MRQELSVRCVRGAAVLIAAVLCSMPAAAQTPDPSAGPGVSSLEQLMSAEVRSVFGASRYLQRVIDAPASVSIVTAEEIERFGYTTLADILRGVRGLYVTYDRNYSYLGVRGASRAGDYNTRVLLLVDGHRLNDNIYDHAVIGTEFPIDVDLIERVEIVRGPSSTLYGTNAFFAVVNVVTRRGGALPSFSGAVEAGSLGTRRARATVTGDWSRGEFVLSASGATSDGQRDLRLPGLPGGGVVHPDLDRDEYAQVFASVRAGDWTAQGVLATREKGIPTGAFGTRLDDPGSATVDARAYLSLQYLGDWRGTSLRLRGAYDAYQYDGDYVYADGEGSIREIDEARGRWWSTEMSGVRRLGDAHVVTAGLELRGNTRQDQSLWTDTGETLLDDRRDSFVWSLFAQDEFTIRPGLLVNAGVGFDHFPSFGGHGTYRGAVIYKPASDRAWKLIYGTAFRAPNAYEQHYYADATAANQLRPERVRTLEAVWEQYLRGGVRISGSVFRNRASDVISLVADPGQELELQFENVDELRAAGFGVEVEGMFAGSVHAFGSYTFADAEVTAGLDAPNAPRHLFVGRVTSPVAGGAAVVGCELRRVSDRVAVNGLAVPGATIGRLSVGSRPLLHGLRLRLTVDNLFNTSYADPGGEEHPVPAIPQDGRTARLRLTWEF